MGGITELRKRRRANDKARYEKKKALKKLWDLVLKHPWVTKEKRNGL